MVQLNGFEVRIIPKNGSSHTFSRTSWDETLSWYVELPHKVEYTLRLGNNRNTIADAVVKMEGNKIGQWRINPHSHIDLERPAEIARRFTFLAEGTPEAEEAGIQPGARDNGLIEVTFRPKKESKYMKIPEHDHEVFVPTHRTKWMSAHAPLAASGFFPERGPQMRVMGQARVAAPEYQGGATVLGEKSHQQFNRVKAIPENEIDQDNVTTIYIRLVSQKEQGRKTAYPMPIGVSNA